MLSIIYYLVWKAFYRNNPFPPYYGRGKWVLIGVYALMMSVVFKLSDSFMYGHLKLTDVVVSQVISILVTDTLTYFELCLIANEMVTPMPMLLVFAANSVVALAACTVYTFLYHIMYVPHDMLLIMSDSDSLELKRKMEARSDHYRITETVPGSWEVQQLIDAISRHDAVIISDIGGNKRNDILKYCYEQAVRTYVVPKISDIIMEGGQDVTLFDTPLKLVKGRGLTLPQRVMKRTLDIVLCIPMLILASPVFALIAIAIKHEDHGPVIYRQNRVTRNGRIFQIMKFRSMVVDA